MNAPLRKQIYLLLIAISAGLMLGRIIAVDRVDVHELERNRLERISRQLTEKRDRLEREHRDPAAIDAEMIKTEADLRRNAALSSPMFCANDRSRWCTIRALVEPDKRVVRAKRLVDDLAPGASAPEPEYETVWFAIDKVQNEKGWNTIDMVKHPLPDDPDGPGYLYSSKPPLLVVLMAIPYAVMYHGSGGLISLGNDPYVAVRTTLVIINLIPILFSWGILSRLIERYGTTDWGRIFTMGVVCFGTFLSTFVVTLNNHL
ncbi:MAG TPA: hypothetical protein DEB39_15745, partial [Planctomycetaceae bacterium]|nr:hypothetical protein [Planctomycetaceae bacterium]